MIKEKINEEKLWWINNKLWENFKSYLDKDNNLKDYYRIINYKNNKIKIILEKCNIKLHKNNVN